VFTAAIGYAGRHNRHGDPQTRRVVEAQTGSQDESARLQQFYIDKKVDE
jgi:hypothetical protein